jgi:secreted trypsin-like serine protease
LVLKFFKTTFVLKGYWQGGKDTCQGDSGTSVYVKGSVDDKRKYIASGITSYGDGCAEKNKPGYVN